MTNRQLRQTAWVTLFVWMFALMSGAANACLIQLNPQGAPGSTSTQAKPVAGDAAGPATRQVQHVHHHGDDDNDELGDHSAKAVCLKFCADGSSAVMQSNAAEADGPGPVLAASMQWPPAVPVVTASQWPALEWPASVGPPLFIRLLRLTI